MAYKFYNPTEFLVSFNVSRKMESGMVVSKWTNVEPKSYFVTEDAEVAKQARLHTELNRALESLKGYLTEVKDKNVISPLDEPAAEAPKASEKIKKLR